MLAFVSAIDMVLEPSPAIKCLRPIKANDGVMRPSGGWRLDIFNEFACGGIDNVPVWTAEGWNPKRLAIRGQCHTVTAVAVVGLFRRSSLSVARSHAASLLIVLM